MKDSPLISVALCTYNGEAFLRPLMDSLLAQTYPNVEIIVVDDCSTDQTKGIVMQYAAKNSSVRFFENQTNLGYNRNFEKALQLCSGALIAICDQDDIWHRDKLSIQQQKMQDHQLVYHDSEFIDDKGVSMNFKMTDKFKFYRGGSPLPFLLMNCVSGHSILLKKTLLSEILPFPPGFHYDQWIAFVATDKGSIDFIDQCLVQYRQHEKNSTDVLAVRSGKEKKSTDKKIEKLKQEQLWLSVCAAHATGHSAALITELSRLCEKRNRSFLSLSMGMVIWQHQELLLYLLKKSSLSKFFFTLRQIWGPGTKKIL